jgi:putative tryptophan/tyrosine transport system substrate-binding protein
MTVTIGRRELLAALGGAALAWPLAARAQQTAMPVIGYLHAGSPGPNAHNVAVFRQSLAEAGYVERRNVAIEYRWAEGQYVQLPAMAAELVHRQVAVILATPIPAALAAKAATATIPILFSVAGDPVKLGLVAGLARPGGNATGVNFFQAELGAKQLGLLRELVPAATRIGLLVNPTNANVEGVTKDVTAASTSGLQIDVVRASDTREIESAFATLVRDKADALSWSHPTRSSSAGKSSSPRWRRAMRFQPFIMCASTRRSAA